MATPNLNLTHLTASQNNKETTANLVFDGLDNAMNLSDPMTITGDKNVTAAELRGAVLFNLTGSPGATFVLTVPTSIERLFIVYNNTDQTCSLELEDAGTDGISIIAGSAVLVHTNGTTLVAIAGGTSTGGGSGTTGITIQDESVTLSALIETLDFVGGGVQAFLNSDETVTIYVPSAVSGSGVTIEDEGVQLSTLIETLNFVGAGITAYLNSDETVDIVVPGAGTATFTVNEDGSLVSNTVNTLNFTGAGVNLFENSDGSITVEIPAVLATSTVIEFTTDLTLTADHFDGNTFLKGNSGSALNVFVPDDLDVTEPVTLIGEGAGLITVVADGSGVTLKSADSLVATRAQYSSLTIIPDQDAGDGNTYWIVGDLA